MFADSQFSHIMMPVQEFRKIVMPSQEYYDSKFFIILESKCYISYKM